MNYVGVDPGKKGGYAVIDACGAPYVRPWDDGEFVHDMCVISGDMEPRELVACVEKVGAHPGQGVTSMFSFGQSYGFILGVLAAFGIPYQLVSPIRWKAEFGLNSDKAASVEVCKRLFPGVNLLPTDKCRKDSDGMAEALLMAEYARRKM